MRFTPQMRQLSWLVERPIAHRGLHGADAPENSSAAFAGAIAKNFAIECDLQISSDGEAVVFHDDSLGRMTGTQGRVREKSVSDLRKTKLGNSNCTIQTLGELLDQVAGRVTLVIEIKSHWDRDSRLTLRALKVLQSYGGPYAVMSFDPAIVSMVADQAPNLVRGIVADRVHDAYYTPLNIARRVSMRQFLHIESTMPHFVSFDANGLPFEPVQEMRAAGIPVITWTITSDAMARRARRHADQITFEGYLPE